MKKIGLIFFILLFSINSFCQTAEDYIIKGKSKSELEDYNGAIDYFSKAIQINPKNAEAYFYLGLAQVNLQDYKGAIISYTKAIECDTVFSEAYYYRGISKSNLQDYINAIQDFNKAIKIDPNNLDAYFYRGGAKKESQDLPGAISDFSYAIKLNPKFAKRYEAEYIWNKYMSRQLNDKDLIDAWDFDIMINPESVTAYNERGQELGRHKEYHKALADFNKAITLNPKFDEAYYNRGITYYLLQNYEAAIDDLTFCIKDHHEYIQMEYLYRGKAKLCIKDYQGAIRDFTVNLIIILPLFSIIRLLFGMIINSQRGILLFNNF